MTKKREIESFSKRYLVDEEVVTSAYMKHLSHLHLKKKLRKNTKQAEKSIQQRIDHYSDNVINSDDDLILNQLMKLLVLMLKKKLIKISPIFHPSGLPPEMGN